MKRRVTRALLAGMFILGAAGAVEACTIDPSQSTCPRWIFVSVPVQDPERPGFLMPDPSCLAVVVVRDFVRNPKVGASVLFDFSDCPDIALCSATINGQTVDCANRKVWGITDQNGQCSLGIIGAASPGATGCGLDGVRIFGNYGHGDIELCTATAVVLDQDGAGMGSNGVTLGDVSVLYRLFGQVAGGSMSYQGRGDLDGNGAVTIADVALHFGHFGRLQAIGATGCGAAFCGSP